MPLMWCETEKCITSERRDSQLQGCPGHCCCYHWARPASGGDTPGLSLGPTVGTETHKTVSGPGALTSVHWTRGHVSLAETASQENCQSEDKEEAP